MKRRKKNLSEKLREASQADTVMRPVDVQTQIAEHTEESEQRKQEIMDLLGNRLLRKQKSNILIQREIRNINKKIVLARNILKCRKMKEQEEQLHEYKQLKFRQRFGSITRLPKMNRNTSFKKS